VQCSTVYPIGADHFVKHKSNPAMVGGSCRICQRAACKSHYERNKEAYHARSRAFERANKDWQSDRNKKYRAENSEKISARLKLRWDTDHLYRTQRIIRNSIADAFRRKGFTKRHRASSILGCTWDELQKHIEKQFVIGMSWENRSAWEVDHIVPVSTAKTEEDLVSLNHFTNLRPLWTALNRAKSDTITHLI
jgi:Na+-translocating ferredoxin:NAD+ oxidoreductase RnfC subunit